MAKVSIRLIVAGLMLTALAVYAVEQKSGPREVFHSFEFGSYGENANIEVLNYKYGDSRTAGTYVEDYDLKQGHIGQGTSTHGYMPLGDFLWVKWRDLSTGKEYEDRVDLRNRLPSDMDHKTIHFVIKGPQLIVYLISAEKHEVGEPYKRYCETLYPTHVPTCGDYKY